VKVLIDIGHPAHVHLFKNFTREFQKRGHLVHFSVRSSECEVELLKANGFSFSQLGKKGGSVAGKIMRMARFDLRLLRIALKFKPDLLLSHGSIYAAHVAAMLKKPHISMEDSGNMEQIRLYRPFTKAILTPDILNEQLGKKQVRYKGYHELCYLHPRYFRRDKSIKGWLGLREDEPYCILRFVSWKATHDIGARGFSGEEKLQLVKKLSDRFRVFITSENEVQEELKAFRLSVPPELLHQVLAFADIVISEGATIASEAGLLGSPAIYYSSIARSYLDDQEKYGTVYNCKPGNGVMQKIDRLVAEGKENHWQKSQKLIAEKIDVNAFLVWFVENYPESFDIMKKDADYQLRFR
jgi:predicted glycosyltransferase